ncbi:hypothetical protein [Klebsiella sp. BIGb0407]|uniref:hypothetical protein n=1 Tax=Klebsiella sp. BIGb0407 TaxID=2940603 RepID=UPI00216724CF|nr:hypothetical protein [Klebsiella sp. BIGb0407]MCS3429615.1 EAL domain-containing protein (putative c-di-GMP-specific phosphodiesterase class I) [Klebsiella sp. BIGb0407]
MNNFSGDTGSAHHYFKPAWRSDNRLMGMEIMTCLIAHNSSEYLSPAWQSAHLDANQQIALFNEKVLFLENVKTLLESWNITIWLNINDIILTEMMQNTDWITRLQNLSFLTLMIDEDFPGMVYGRNNLRLIWLAEKFPLALANLGSGQSSNRAIFDRLFRHIFLSQEFIHHQINRPSFVPFANAIIRQIAPFCEALMVSGIDDITLYHQVKSLNFEAMRGNLWPAIAAENISDLFSTSEH